MSTVLIYFKIGDCNHEYAMQILNKASFYKLTNDSLTVHVIRVESDGFRTLMHCVEGGSR